MPAINVARTDTFEVQRQKINQIGDILSNISAGGSDLQTGNLKLGDGLVGVPSLGFINEPSLGVYRPQVGTIGFVSDSKKINDFSLSGNIFYKDVVVRKRYLDTDLLSVLNSGQNYDGGTYQDIALVGGTGEGATSSIVISPFGGSITTIGRNYVPGSYTGVLLEGGSGSNTNVSFSVPGAEGTITQEGSGYAPGSYTDVSLTNGSGTNIIASIEITGSTSQSGSITNSGSGYTQGIYNSVDLYNVPTSTFVVTANGSTNYIIDGNSNPALNLLKGNTYRFDISDATNGAHQLGFREVGAQEAIGTEYYQVVQNGSNGTAGSFVDLIISPYAPTETIEYYCIFHPSTMNGDINIAAGSVGQHGYSATADITVDGNGNVTNVSFVNSGFSYKQNDILEIVSSDAGGTGSGFQFTLNTPVYAGVVENVSITDPGQNYISGDILSVNDSDVGSGGGSGFQFTLTTTPGGINELNFLDKGNGYQSGDVLTLPTSVTTQAYLPGTVLGVSANLVNSTTLTIADTSPIVPGMEIASGEGSGAGYPIGTTVVSVNSSTTLTTSSAPSSTGAAVLNFSSTGSFTTIEVDDVSGIQNGFVVSGSSSIPADTNVFGTNAENSTVTLNNAVTSSGITNLTFSPPFGTGSPALEFTISSLGVVEEFTISEGGNGYSVGDQLSISASDIVQPIEYTVSNTVTQTLTFTTTLSDTTFSVGDSIKRLDGALVGFTFQASTVLLGESGNTYSNVSGTSANGQGATFNITRAGAGGETAQEGEVESVVVTSVGYGYQNGDTITIAGTSIGGSSPADDLIIDIQSASVESAVQVLKVKSSGGNIDYIIAEENNFSTNDNLVFDGTSSPVYVVSTASVAKTKFLIDTNPLDGLPGELHPSLTLYSGSTYQFNLGSGVDFAFSEYVDGTNEPSSITNVVTTLDVSSSQITVVDTTGILPGMVVTVQQGSTGNLIDGTTVESVDSSTTLTLSTTPQTAGSVTLDFSGVEFTDGVVRSTGNLTIKVSDTTPTLYYYNPNLEDASGEPGDESTITIDLNNPKVFGSGFLVSVLDLLEEDVISSAIDTGEFRAQDIVVNTSITTNTLTSATITSTTVETTNLTTQTISNSTNNITVESPLKLDSDFNINDKLTVDSSTGDLETAGELKTSDSLNVNDITFITGNTLSTAVGNDFIIDTPINQVVKIAAETAFQIPAGDEDAKPTTSYDGYIRFNTDTNQYEGYSEATSSWSSLGGVRDLDGNTTILAEESVGANDNTLWFINDTINTVRFTKTHQEFVNAKRIRSVNTSAPDYVSWTANTPYGPGENVDVGDYVRYKTFVFEVIAAGTTASSGSEPTDTSGNNFTNGTTTLKYITSSASTLLFEEISNLRIGEDVPLTFDNDLRITKNTIASDVSDITIKPFTEKKVIINATSSLVVPVGDINQRGAESRGSIRYNTTDNQFEGYNGAQWGGLGGVKDVDQDTKIEAETSPGNDEDILYFFNAGNNTLRLTTTQLEFGTVDTIVSSDTDTLNINASTITFDSLATTIDNTNSTISFITTSKDNLDFGLSTGINNDHLLRLKDTGEVVFNLGFGTGTPDNLTLLNDDLTNFELKHTRVSTSKIPLERGTLNSGNSTIYSTATESSAKVCLTAHNTTTGDKELVEYYVIDDGTDVYFTDYNNVKTGSELVSTVFDIDPSNNVRITFTLNTGLTVGDNVTVTLIKTVTKR
jgi:hypothetical protein